MATDEAGPATGEAGHASAASAAPMLKVINPDATPEEVAALVAVFAALGQPEAPSKRSAASEWASPHRMVRVRYSHGPGGWVSSGMPR